MEKQILKTPGNNLPKPLTVLFESTADALMQVIALVEAENFNRVPQTGSWTPAQHLKHLRLSLQGAVSTLNGPVTLTTRSPDQYVDTIKGIFLDFDAKYPAAPSIMPEDRDYDKTLLTNELASVLGTLKQMIQTRDLTSTCITPEFPGIGCLTRLEWAAVVNYHTYRHVHQLNEIVQGFASLAGS